jgi:regulator of protease activity HflC (stomatin/prohibitin superfamily)|tara:strand:- start:26012 stop:26875 length:864 start_codon:yes stop_codon:yes gene_type:complete
MKQEKNIVASSGYIYLLLFFVLIATTVIGIVITKNPIFLVCAAAGIFLMPGFFTVNPNSSKVLVLFGAYKGTIRDNGFFWANPFFSKQKISLRARNFDSERVKVNDKIGNPILINVILVWKVSDTFKSAFDVDNYEEFVRIQTDAAVRKLAGSYPYDNFDEHGTGKSELTLRSGMDEVNEALENEITERLTMAGIEVMEARIGYLAYAPEIASAMLKRQQAVAIVAARKKIVEGAVGMVEDALKQLSDDGIIDFDDDKKATMVSNLMVVLCGDKEVTPVINTGTLNG